MSVVVEPEHSDPWLHRFVAPGMTYCVLREEDGPPELAGRTSQTVDGDGGLETVLGRLVGMSTAPGTAWIAHLSGPLDEVVAAVEITGQAVAQPGIASPTSSSTPAQATVVLSAGDPALRALIAASRDGHRSLALFQVRQKAVADVLRALEHGRDSTAVARAEIVIVQQPALRRCTFAVRAPSPESSPPGLGPALGVPSASRPSRRRLVLLAGAIAAVAVAAGAAAIVLHRGSTPGSQPGTQSGRQPPPGGAARAPVASAPPAGTAIGVGPPPRTGAAVVFDEDRANTILFGGTAATGGVLGDTWVFDGHAWSQKSSPRQPPPRTGAGITYDPGIEEVVLFGGTSPQGTALDDTWVWDGSVWKDLIPTRAHPSAGIPAGLAFDEAHQSLVLVVTATARKSAPVAGTTWSWGGDTWRRLATPSSPLVGADTAMAYDPAISLTVLVDAGTEVTWTFDGTTWRRLPNGGLGLDRAAPTAMAYEPSTQSLVLVQSATGGRPSTTWTFDGSAWHRSGTPSAPEVVTGLVTDSTTGTVTAFAGPAVPSDLAEKWSWQTTMWGP